MEKYASLGELREVAIAYCIKMGYEFIFAHEYKFGFADKNENLWTLSYFELEEKLKEMNK